MNIDEMKKLYTKANKVYNNDPNGKLLMTDSEFDTLERRIKKVDPEWTGLRATGAKVNKKVEVRLPHFMPSLSKVYPEDLAKWRAKQKVKLWLMMHKLDGSALIGTYRKGRCVFLATRGDGTLGKDISFLIPFLNLPVIKEKSEVSLRFEAVVKKEVWAKKWAETFDNARQMANGLLNRRNEHKGMRDISMVVLGVYDRSVLAGLQWARSQGFDTVRCEIVRITYNFEELLTTMREQAEYDIDGAVLAPPDADFQYESADRPKWTAAFKVNDDASAVETRVVDVIWQLSRTNRWTPKIEIAPTKMKGVTVTYATAHNAEWLHERKIGIGAVVKVVRSGDVIPKIVGVVKAAKKLPYPPGSYEKAGVHYYAIGQHKEAEVREIYHFFSTLGIENIARKSLDKLYDAGFTKTIDHIVAYGRRMAGYTEAGMGDAMTAKIYADMGRVLTDNGITLLQLMNASNCFESFGERKLTLVQNHYMKKGDKDPLKVFLQMNDQQHGLAWKDIVADKKIKGMAESSARQFLEGMVRFKEWFRPIHKTKLIKIVPPVVSAQKKKVVGKLTGQKVSFTGYRNAEHEAAIEAMGGEVVPFGGKTTLLLYKAGGKSSSKIDKARAKGLAVSTFEELK